MLSNISVSSFLCTRKAKFWLLSLGQAVIKHYHGSLALVLHLRVALFLVLIVSSSLKPFLARAPAGRNTANPQHASYMLVSFWSNNLEDTMLLLCW